MKVESGYDIPDCQIGRRAKYPFGSLSVGDRFEIPEGKYKRVRTCISMRHRNKPERFVVRQVGDVWYCWRTA